MSECKVPATQCLLFQLYANLCTSIPTPTVFNALLQHLGRSKNFLPISNNSLLTSQPNRGLLPWLPFPTHPHQVHAPADPIPLHPTVVARAVWRQIAFGGNHWSAAASDNSAA